MKNENDVIKRRIDSDKEGLVYMFQFIAGRSD